MWKVAQIVSRRDWIHHQWCWIVVDVVVVIQVITDHIHTWRFFAVLSRSCGAGKGKALWTLTWTWNPARRR